MTPLQQRVLEIMKAKGLLTLDEPVELASGEMSRHFIDGKEALADGADLEVACQAVLDVVADAGLEFDAVGGLTLGADHLSHGVALVGHKRWFVVRKAPKGRGTNRRIEGATLEPGVRVLLVDDIVSTGGSIQEAYHLIVETGATVVAAVTMVDRGEVARAFFEQQQVPYLPLLTYRQLDIPPVGPAS